MRLVPNREHLTQAIAAARQYEVPLTIHLGETQTEVEDIKQRYNATPVQHLENLGFLEPRVFAAHVVWPNESEIALDPTAVPAKTVLRMATLGGAEALGLADKIGAIKVGLQADLLQVQLKEPHLTPLYDVISHLVYTADAQDVDTVIVDGQVLMHKREMLTVDPDKIRLEATSIGERIKAELRPFN